MTPERTFDHLNFGKKYKVQIRAVGYKTDDGMAQRMAFHSFYVRANYSKDVFPLIAAILFSTDDDFAWVEYIERISVDSNARQPKTSDQKMIWVASHFRECLPHFKMDSKGRIYRHKAGSIPHTHDVPNPASYAKLRDRVLDKAARVKEERVNEMGGPSKKTKGKRKFVWKKPTEIVVPVCAQCNNRPSDPSFRTTRDNKTFYFCAKSHKTKWEQEHPV